jgi:hypothetical protein
MVLRRFILPLLLGFVVAALFGVYTEASITQFGGVNYTWPTSHGVSGKLLTTDGSKTLSWTADPGSPAVPSTIVMFSDGACPAGWSDLPGAGGRYIVGTPSGVGAGGTAGTALSSLENRATGTHSHTDSESLTVNASAHSHGVTDPAHSHAGEDDYGGNYAVEGGGGTYSGKLKTSGGYDHTTNTASAGLSLGNTDTNVTVSSSGVTVGNMSSGVAGTNAPYIQLRACVKA